MDAASVMPAIPDPVNVDESEYSSQSAALEPAVREPGGARRSGDSNGGTGVAVASLEDMRLQ